MTYLAMPFVWALEALNNIFQNYALTILVFTVLVNVCLSPLSIKQQKSQAKQAKLRPKLEALKEKCGDDKMKYQTAMQDLYQRENVSMTGGCLPMIIRMVLLIGVYNAIRMMLQNYGVDFTAGDTVIEDEAVSQSFMLFGLDLAQTPKFSIDIFEDFQVIWIIPILSGVAAFLTSQLSMLQQKHINPQSAEMGGSMKGVMLIMPLFSIWIAFSVPAAVGYYWICSNLVNMAITLIVNYAFAPNKIVAKETAKSGLERRKEEREKIAKVG